MRQQEALPVAQKDLGTAMGTSAVQTHARTPPKPRPEPPPITSGQSVGAEDGSAQLPEQLSPSEKAAQNTNDQASHSNMLSQPSSQAAVRVLLQASPDMSADTAAALQTEPVAVSLILEASR